MRLVTIVCAMAALAACATPGSDYAGVAAELDQARTGITPPLGATTYTLDMTQPAPAWQQTAPMAFGRAHHNLTILADGSVLASGGTS